MAKEKNLDLLLVNEAFQEKNKKRKTTIPVTVNGRTEDAVLYIDEVFAESKIRNCVQEFVSRIDAVRKMNEGRFNEVIESYMLFLIIKYFSSFPAPDKYKEQVVVINMLLETNLLYRIFAEFNPEEIQKITDEIATASDILEEDVNEFVELAEELGMAQGEDKEEGDSLVIKES